MLMHAITRMASGNINCSHLGRNSEFPSSFNFIPSTTILQDMGSGTTCLDLQPSLSRDEAYISQDSSVNVFDNENTNHPTGLLNNNQNEVLPDQTSQAQLPGAMNNTWEDILSINTDEVGLNENILPQSNQNYTNPSSQLNLIRIVIPEDELTVNIDTDEGVMHNWRPNLMNSLSSDFFVTQPNMDNEARNPPLNEIEQLHLTTQSYWDSQFEKAAKTNTYECEQGTKKSCPYDSANYRQLNVIQNHVQHQRTHLNNINYEITHIKRRLHEQQILVVQLKRELEEKLRLQNSKDMQKLRDENAELRLECQCLCMEVDFYLKGKAPLGEVDEKFYKANTTEANKAAVAGGIQSQIQPEQQHYNSEEQEEANKWQCPKCTFANHPAINSCEMCHMTRIRKETTPPHSTDTCYCHPKEESNFS